MHEVCIDGLAVTCTRCVRRSFSFMIMADFQVEAVRALAYDTVVSALLVHLFRPKQLCQLFSNLILHFLVYNCHKNLPPLFLVTHSSASSGQVLSLIASVKSTEYVFVSWVIVSVTAGPRNFALMRIFLNSFFLQSDIE